MRRSIVVAAMLICGVATASPQRWKLAAPSGWSDITSSFDGTPQAAEMRHGMEDFGGTSHLTVYSDSAGGALIIVEASIPMADPYSFEGGVRGGMSKGGNELAYRTWRDGDTLAAEQTVEKTGQKMYGKRYIGQTSADKVVAVTATCVGPEAQCKSTLATFDMERSDLIELEEKADINTAAYVMGGVTGAVLVGAIILGIVRRKKKS